MVGQVRSLGSSRKEKFIILLLLRDWADHGDVSDLSGRKSEPSKNYALNYKLPGCNVHYVFLVLTETLTWPWPYVASSGLHPHPDKQNKASEGSTSPLSKTGKIRCYNTTRQYIVQYATVRKV